MARINNGERELRIKHALKLLASGHSFSSTVSQCATEWGVSRCSARRYVSAAMAEFREDCQEINSTELLAETIHRLQELARKAEAAGQFSAAVGAVKQLAELTGLGGDSHSRGGSR